MDQESPSLEQSAEVIEWMLFHVDVAESDEFWSGLDDFRRRRAREENGEVITAFREWWTSWMVSLRLHSDVEYRRQVKESAERLRDGDLGEPVGPKELPGRLRT